MWSRNSKNKTVMLSLRYYRDKKCYYIWYTLACRKKTRSYCVHVITKTEIVLQLSDHYQNRNDSTVVGLLLTVCGHASTDNLVPWVKKVVAVTLLPIVQRSS